MMEFSDKMWDRSQKIMHFMLHRGAKAVDIDPAWRVTNLNAGDTRGEVKALAATLDILKKQVEEVFYVHRHANNKKDHTATPSLDSYDPSVISRFFKLIFFKLIFCVVVGHAFLRRRAC
jgi:hypothetical protein